MSGDLNNRSLTYSDPYNYRGKSNVSEWKISKLALRIITKHASTYLNFCSKTSKQ